MVTHYTPPSVLLKRLGVHVDDASIDSDIQRKFRETINGNMSVKKQRALQILFSGDFDPAALGIGSADVEDVDAVEA
jgi:oligoribonuclease NrnB/cAMP/cGMP phosphodiesterase (DHH superfamily)